MKLLVPSTAALAVLLSMTAAGQTPPAATPAAKGGTANPERAAAEKLLIANERKVNEAVAKGDQATFISLVSADAVAADASGFVPTKMFVTMLDQLKMTKWDILNPQVVWIDATSAVLTYTWTGEGTLAGQPLPSKTYSSTVWTKKAGKWVAVYHQETTAAK